MPDALPASNSPSPETFEKACSRLIFQARDECLKKGQRITRDIIERILGEQKEGFHLMPTKPVLSDAVAESIFRAYPRREGKKAALKAIGIAMRGTPSTDLLQKTIEYAKAVAKWPQSFRYSKEGRDLVPHPATWFNEGRFMDDPTCWEKGSKKESARQYDKI